jgi:uncharacterized protein (DUF2345 family)
MHAPLVVVTAQAGIGVAAGDGLHGAAGEVAHVGSGRDMQVAVGDAMSIHSGQAIGLLAGAVGVGENDHGIQLYAGQGDVQLQAQNDAMTLAARDLVRLISANSRIEVAAAKRIEICTEGGASLTLEGGNITFACPGTISIKAASKRFAGPASINHDMPTWSKSSFDEKFLITDELTGEPAKNQPYRITLPGKQIIEGITNDRGETSLATSAAYGSLTLQLLPKNKG